MEENDRTLLVGLDLCEDFSQLSCYNHTIYEPESICLTNDESSYEIPTRLALDTVKSEWLFGMEATEALADENVTVVDHILSKVSAKEQTEIVGNNYTAIGLLEKFLRRVLALLKREYPNRNIGRLVITLEKPGIALVEGIYEALEPMGLYPDRVTIQSHTRSYLYYALSQKKELWLNDVGMFDFGEAGLQYYQITINRRVTPHFAQISHRDYSDTLGYDLVEEIGDTESLSYIFENISKSALYKQLLSTVYITGKGFEGNWADEAITGLCVGRRVFKGLNMYTKGACYAARDFEEGKINEFFVLDEEAFPATITLKIFTGGQSANLLLIRAGSSWFLPEQSYDFILDDVQEIPISVQNPLKNDSYMKMMDLDGLERRPDRMTRVRVRVRCVDGNTLVIAIKDLGFGDYYKGTDRIWEKTITVG